MLKVRSSFLSFIKTNKNRFYFSNTAPLNHIKEEKIIIGKHKINYLKVGDGPHKVFCLPGALGTIWTDFKPQIEGLDKSAFTVIAWDPPGYGKSRPPEKEFSPDFYEVDALAAHNLMQVLGITKYSILGWSDGGITGMIVAAKFPQEVTKLAIWGANSFILPTELQIYEKIKDIRTWSPKMKQPMIDVYGEKDFSKLWAAWVEGVKNIYHEKEGNICREMLKDIKCPTLILHGEKDPMIEDSHISHLLTNIDGSRVILYPEGKHNIHLRYAEDFNKKVEEFLLSDHKTIVEN